MGGADLIFSKLEIEVLRLCAWCKDIPLDSAVFLTDGPIQILLRLGCLRLSKCGTSYRVTPEGFRVLDAAGYHHEPDRQYRGRGKILDRRIQTAAITTFFYRCGADVFLNLPKPQTERLSFLPAFALRRNKGSNILGGTRLAGIAYTSSAAFIPYFISDDDKGIYANVEARIFMSNHLLCGRTPIVLYTGKPHLAELIEAAQKARGKSPKSTTETYADAAYRFSCPVFYIPLSMDGVRQFQIVSHMGYRERLMKYLLGKDYSPSILPHLDAQHKKSGELFLIGIDCDFIRMRRALETVRMPIHIIVLEFQLAAVSSLLRGENAILHTLETGAAETILELNYPQLPISIPYQTDKGGCLVVSNFPHHGSSQKQAKIELYE